MSGNTFSNLRTILYGGLVAGTIDIFAASLINLLNPVIIFHAIASGILGRQAFRGGIGTAVIGLLLQWGMALVIAAIYVAARSVIPFLKRHWAVGGISYGFVIFFVMNYLVVPLSNAAPPHYFTPQHLLHRFTVPHFFENLAAMVLFGLIVAFFARRGTVALPQQVDLRESESPRQLSVSE